MRLRLIRHATLLVKTRGRCLLVDPMLDPAGARPPRDPLVELPEPAEVVMSGLDAVGSLPEGEHLAHAFEYAPRAGIR